MAGKEEADGAVAPLLQRSVAEGLGTAFLLIAVVGSGIMAERLSGGNAALALLANSTATGAALIALILAFGQVSGAHLNPAVTLSEAMMGGVAWADVPWYIAAQVAGAFAGVGTANRMFDEPLFFASAMFARVPARFSRSLSPLSDCWL